MRKGHSSRDSTQETHTSSQETARESSHRPRNKVRRFLGKVKDGVNKLRTSRSKNSRSRSPVPPNVHASSIPHPEDAQEPAKYMRPLSEPVTTVVSVSQDAQAGLDTAGKFQDTYLKPLRIFDEVIGKIANVHPYAKMALGTLSCAAKIILAQADRDTAILKLIEKLCQVYDFIIQDQTLGKISSMRIVLGNISADP
ncbi:hypothetical protein BDR07DRAFT_1492834 [Suillus spraguei]|nr:hypothetical protein BDR07DRAFT_1492834 [Suillus spraguei]